MIKKLILFIFIVLIAGFSVFGIYENQRGILNSDGRKSILQDLHYDVTIYPDGSSRVNENRTYEFIKGTFTRGFLEVEGQIDHVEVFEGNIPYSQLQAFDSSRPKGYFAVEPTGTKTRIEWYYWADDKDTRTFTIKYRVPHVAKLYNDCVDYFQKFVSRDNVYKIKNLSILVHLPSGADQSNTKIWAHGPVGGNIEFKDKTSVILSMKNVPPSEYIEARFLMPTTTLTPSDQKISVDRYTELLEMENKASGESDRKRQINSIIGLFTLLLSSTIIILPFISVIKYRFGVKRFKPEFEPPYYRDLPSEIYPAELDYLMNHYTGKINTSQQISATLLDLIHKGSILGQVVEKGGFGKKNDTLFTEPKDAVKGTISHEKLLMDFLFKKVGNQKGQVTLTEIKKFCSHKKTAPTAYKFYTDFSRSIERLAAKRDYFETQRNKLPKSINRYLILNVILMILPIVLMNTVEDFASTPIYYISISAFMGFMIVTTLNGKPKPLLTQNGENQRTLWIAFREFLQDFTTFEQKELPELFMWEKYLVYATILGVAQKLLKQLYARYPELRDVNQESRLFYLITQDQYQNAHHHINAISTSLSDALRDSANIVAKSASKGSGGGFSSGGSDAGSGAGGSSGGVD